ncbi:MAG: hypothetical protein A2104_05285 [Candidatus Melainabacteria bacterium GWF2_32_7]|nr:MAG: hypothetical protein A2104_05285 [Candidatus Melainabacteria bacterium GWF2_32_7]
MRETIKAMLVITATIAGLYSTYAVLSHTSVAKNPGRHASGGGHIYYGGQIKEFNEAQKKAFQW